MLFPQQNDLDVTLSSIENAVLIDDHGRLSLLLDRFFSENLCSRIHGFFRNPGTHWNKVPLQESLPRESVDSPEQHPICSEVHELFNHPEILAAFEKRIRKKIRSFGVSFWRDLPGYELPLHVDNDAFDCAAQIYVTDWADRGLGTSIASSSSGDSGALSDTVLFTIPYRGNSGYFLQSSQKTPHGLLTSVPPGRERYSVYARFRYVL